MLSSSFFRLILEEEIQEEIQKITMRKFTMFKMEIIPK